MGGFIKNLVKVLPGSLAVAGIFYIAGGAAAALGIPGVTALMAGGYGLIVGVAYGIAASADKDNQ